MKLNTCRLGALTLCALILAACSLPADDPNYVAPGNEIIGGEFEPLDPSAAAGEIESMTATPTSIGIETPLNASPAPGATIITLVGGNELDDATAAAMSDAAAALGWTLEVSVPEDPASLEATFEAALASKPSGIHISGAQLEIVRDAAVQAGAAGVPLVCTGCVSDPADGLMDTSIAGAAQQDAWAQLLSAGIEVSAAENGGSVSVDVYRRAGTPASAAFGDSLAATLTSACPGCLVTQNDLSSTGGAEAMQEAATAIVANPLAQWVVADAGDLFEGISEELVAQDADPALILGGNLATKQAIAGIKEGTQTAWTAYSAPVTGWRVVDAFARIIGGQPVETTLLPSQLLVSEDVDSLVLDPEGNYLGVADYQDQFKKLWLVG